MVQIRQFVMAYRADQASLQALLPEGFSSLRPVLRINAELRAGAAAYVEFNTPVAGRGRRGWLNLWSAAGESAAFRQEGKTARFTATEGGAPLLAVSFTGVGKEGGCPREDDNDGTFYPGAAGAAALFRPAEAVAERKEYCDCVFGWTALAAGALSPAAIPSEGVLGAYTVAFSRDDGGKALSGAVFMRAGAERMEALVRLQTAVFHGEQGIPAEEIAAFTAYDPVCWCAVTPDGAPAAAVAAWQEGGQTHMGRFVTHPDLRGRHLGTALLRFALGDLFAGGTEAVYAEARDETVRIAAAMGGAVIGAPTLFCGDSVTPIVIRREDYLAAAAGKK